MVLCISNTERAASVCVCSSICEIRHVHHLLSLPELLRWCYVSACVIITTAYLGDLGVCAAAVSGCGVHPSALWGSTLLSQGALLLPYAPAALKSGVCLQTHPTAVSQCIALIQVSCRWDKERLREWKPENKASSLHIHFFCLLQNTLTILINNKTCFFFSSYFTFTSVRALNPKGVGNGTLNISAQIPIGHGTALKKPCTSQWLLNESPLITLTFYHLST